MWQTQFYLILIPLGGSIIIGEVNGDSGVGFFQYRYYYHHMYFLLEIFCFQKH